MSQKLLVTGGTGFIGAEVCRLGIAEGYRMVSVSRRGRSGAPREPWTDGVKWIQGDIFETEGWRSELHGCMGVVHAIGIIRQRPREGTTFERVNGEAAVLVGREAEAAGVPRLAFISAGAKPPLIADAYLTAKREAEEHLSEMALEAALLRPVLAVGSRRPETLLAGFAFAAAVRMPVIGTRIRDLRALPVQVIARCALRAAAEAGHGGVHDVDAIERLGRAGQR